MARRSTSQAIYRALLRIYPREFRARFASDLQADFADLLQAHGTMAAWLRVVADLCRSVPGTHMRARAERQRARATAYQGETAMGSLKSDVRHAVRALVKAPVFTVVTVVTLALGIGANSAIFSLVNAVLLRPLGYADPNRLMLVYEGFGGAELGKMGVSPPDIIDLTAQQRSFSSIGAYRTQQYELSGSGQPEQITGVRVSASVFPILGVQPAHGRAFLETEDQPGQDVAVLSHGLWQRRYGSDERRAQGPPREGLVAAHAVAAGAVGDVEHHEDGQHSAGNEAAKEESANGNDREPASWYLHGPSTSLPPEIV